MGYVTQRSEYLDVLNHGYFRVAVAIPQVVVADPLENCRHHSALIKEVAETGALYILFPELSLSGYTIEDYVQQDVLLSSCKHWLDALVQETKEIGALITVGIPLEFDQRLFNCAVSFCKGKIIAIAPKSYLPNYREFYEKRHYMRALDAISKEVGLCGQTNIPFGNDIIMRPARFLDVGIHVEVCEDIWVPVPPSTLAALAGATILANASASNITVAKSQYRRELVGHHSAKNLAACMYTSSGSGESSNDLAWDGHGMIFERGDLTAETPRFEFGSVYAVADVDMRAIVQDRMRQNSFFDNATDILGGNNRREFRNVSVEYFGSNCKRSEYFSLLRAYSPTPFVPQDVTLRDTRCMEIFMMQTRSLARRLQSLPENMQKVVIGVSGGRDSTHALVVTARAMDFLELPRTNIIGTTMPGFGTSEATLGYALRLMESFGITSSAHSISEQVLKAFDAVGHDVEYYSIAYENMQAAARTYHLFSLAWEHGGIVLGTGDLSEAAVGWCTYGIGDHMSHYGINIGVPKTLIEYLIKWTADTQFKNEPNVSEVLYEVLSSAVSPELIPADVNGKIQDTNEKIGVADLRDFFTYYFFRLGFSPQRICRMTYEVFGRKPYVGSNGELCAPYSLTEIKSWLEVFLRRVVANQFKRTCMPNGPKVGTVALSPRGDFRAPSDISASMWLDALTSVPTEGDFEQDVLNVWKGR